MPEQSVGAAGLQDTRATAASTAPPRTMNLAQDIASAMSARRGADDYGEDDGGADHAEDAYDVHCAMNFSLFFFKPAMPIRVVVTTPTTNDETTIIIWSDVNAAAAAGGSLLRRGLSDATKLVTPSMPCCLS